MFYFFVFSLGVFPNKNDLRFVFIPNCL